MKQKTIAVDFDGVLASYNGWKGFDVLGRPDAYIITLLHDLHQEGWKIIIFTTRQDTPTLREWLKIYEVPFNEINRNSDNPECTSIKPIYDIILDDRAINYHGQNVSEIKDQIAEVLANDEKRKDKE